MASTYHLIIRVLLHDAGAHLLAVWTIQDGDNVLCVELETNLRKVLQCPEKAESKTYYLF